MFFRAFSFMIMFIPLCLSAEQLHFVTTIQEITPGIHDSSILTDFPFTNSSDDAVTFVSATTSCACLEASVDVRQYLPKESGVVHAVFTIGDRSGKQTKSIDITTKDSTKPIALTVVINLPDKPIITPPLLAWKIGANPVRKTTIIQFPINSPYTLTRAIPQSPSFRAEIVPNIGGSSYTLFVTPITTDKPIVDIIRLETNLSAVFLVFAKISDD